MCYKYLLCLVTCLCLFLSAPGYCGQEDWRFRTQTEMRQTLPKYLKSPRALYYIILRARKQGLAADLCLQLREIHQKDLQDLDIASAYAFCQYVATNPITPEMARGVFTPEIRKVMALQVEAEYFRGQALKYAPNEREIVLEAGIPMISSGGMGDGGTEKASDLLMQAVKLAPRWADTHYWLGVCDAQLGINAVAYRKTKEYPEHYRKCIAELREAERLESGLHTNCVEYYVQAYHYIKQWHSLLSALDEYFKIRPDMAKPYQKWRQEALDHIRAGK